ncbi:MAG: ribokinase [Sedimentisphaerales bacterium]|nr:ribokinase [Sedimentisphaerales bacterium]
MQRIIVIGSANTDMIIRVDRIPRPGETVLAGRFSTAPGGKGANQAVAAARAGGQVLFLARVGSDVFGRESRQGWRADGIDISCVAEDDQAPSGVAMIFVEQGGENSIAVAPGANARLSADDIRRARECFGGAAAVLMQLEIPLETVCCAAELAGNYNVPVILNPAPARDLPDELLRRVAILTPNESEAEHLTGVGIRDAADLARAARRLIQRGVGAAIITCGARGAYVLAPDYEGLIPAYRVEAVDATAAGDVFNGVLAVALAEGRRIVEAVRLAQAAAALSVTRLGAGPSAPDRRQIEAFYRRQDSNGTDRARPG